jgi:hypothetical protein
MVSITGLTQTKLPTRDNNQMTLGERFHFMLISKLEVVNNCGTGGRDTTKRRHHKGPKKGWTSGGLN